MARTRSSKALISDPPPPPPSPPPPPVPAEESAAAADKHGDTTGADITNTAAAGAATSAMTSTVEFRRKTGAPPARDPASVANAMIHRPSFSLDEPLPATPKAVFPAASGGFLDLPPADQRNFGLLVLLYFLQGIPMGLATGSIPFLLKSRVSYSDIGIFSLASMPYSLKLLWSPIVDAVWSPSVGRRKSWILPIQMLSGIGMLILGRTVEAAMASTGAEGGQSVWSFTSWWFFLVLMCATQDIAVDGWALTLLSPANVAYASTAQTVGLTAGQFLSYTVFLALNSAQFANRWFRSEPLDGVGLVSLSGYLTFWGWAYVAVTLGLGLLKKEERARNEDGIWDVYRIMWGILRLPNVQAILLVHLIAKIGFQANDGVTNLKLIEKGFGNDNMALAVLIDFPFEIGLGYYAGKWSQRYTPMRLWSWGFAGRLGAAVFAQVVVAAFPTDGVVAPWYLLLVMSEHILSTFTNTVMFVAVSAFHANISDPAIGGTYMTLLATVCNLGGTLPRYFVLRLVDGFTVATCHPSPSSSPEKLADLQPFSCSGQADKDACISRGGVCTIDRDGYSTVNILCVLVGALTFVWYIRPKVLALQRLPMSAWRLGGTSAAKSRQ